MLLSLRSNRAVDPNPGRLPHNARPEDRNVSSGSPQAS